MKKSDMICERCICRIDATPGDLMQDLCALGPVRRPVHPQHFCGFGKWRGLKTVKTNIPGIVTDTTAILTYGEWEDD